MDIRSFCFGLAVCCGAVSVKGDDIDALLGRMTPEEKVGQLVQLGSAGYASDDQSKVAIGDDLRTTIREGRESFPTPRSRPFGRLLRSRGIFPWCASGRGRHGLDGGGGPVGCWGAFFGESQISNLKSQTGAGARGWHDRLTGAGRDGRQRTALDAVKWALV